MPSLIRGETGQNAPEINTPDTHATNAGAWFTRLVANEPSTYTQVSDYLKQVMPDFARITNQLVARDTRAINFHFTNDSGQIELSLEELSDGEKCFF